MGKSGAFSPAKNQGSCTAACTSSRRCHQHQKTMALDVQVCASTSCIRHDCMQPWPPELHSQSYRQATLPCQHICVAQNTITISSPQASSSSQFKYRLLKRNIGGTTREESMHHLVLLTKPAPQRRLAISRDGRCLNVDVPEVGGCCHSLTCAYYCLRNSFPAQTFTSMQWPHDPKPVHHYNF